MYNHSYMSSQIIQVKNLKKYYSVYQKEPGFVGSIKSLFSRKYEDVKAVDDISFNIEEGELVGFIGPNGAGKTTTLKVLSGLLYPTSGEVSVLGHVPYKRENKYLKQIALVMGQKNQLWWDLPPTETFLLNKEIYEVPEEKYKEILEELSALLQVKDVLNIQVRKLSLGQRMKCELIAALIHSPKVLFLDEPTIGLDVVMQKNLREFIKEYNQKYKSTIILTSHYMKDVEALCKRVIIINHGTILYDGLLSNLVKKFAPEKFIILTLEKEVNLNDFKEFGEVKKYEFPELVLSVKAKNLSENTSKILQKFKIEDLNVEDPDIEEVIRDVFTSKKRS